MLAPAPDVFTAKVRVPRIQHTIKRRVICQRLFRTSRRCTFIQAHTDFHCFTTNMMELSPRAQAHEQIPIFQT
ncbi:hypothetical protein BC89_19825 [Pseudomonas monteilii]|nr:hypothetical protein BC89_19825 [Pseudomonas monteilii]